MNGTVEIELLAMHPEVLPALMKRCGWELMETIVHEGHELGIFRKEL